MVSLFSLFFYLYIIKPKNNEKLFIKKLDNYRYQYDFVGTKDCLIYDSKSKIVYSEDKFTKKYDVTTGFVCECDSLDYFLEVCKTTLLQVVEENWITKETVEKIKINN